MWHVHIYYVPFTEVSFLYCANWVKRFGLSQGAAGQSSVNPAFQDAWSSDED